MPCCQARARSQFLVEDTIRSREWGVAQRNIKQNMQYPGEVGFISAENKVLTVLVYNASESLEVFAKPGSGCGSVLWQCTFNERRYGHNREIACEVRMS